MIPFLIPLGHNYFVSPTGDDAGDGLSAKRPWRTLARASKVRFGPGDGLVLDGTLEGRLVLEGGGTPGRPVVVRSAGKDRATIVSADGTAIEVRAGGVEIRDLVLRGMASAKKEGHDGILLVAPGGRRAPHVWVEAVDVSGFGGDGISIEGAKESPDGFDDVRLSHVKAHGNHGAGILSADGVAFLGKGYAHRGFRITDCDVSGNLSGSGMVLSGVDGAWVEYCRSSGNRGNGGGVGIWAWCARRVTFRHCIASGTRTGGGDGGGFDLDGGSVDCVVERCLTYDNDGPGAMHCDYPASPRTERNAIRDSVSVDDGRKARGDVYGFGLVTWGSGLYDCAVERNLAVVTQPDPLARDYGALFVTYIRSKDDPKERQLVRGCVFRDNAVRLQEPGTAFVRVGLPERAEGDVRFLRNAYEGEAPFVEGERRLDLADWRTAHPEDARTQSVRKLGDVRNLAPRDLPRFLKMGR